VSSFLDNLDWGNWLYGLFAGGIGGGATAITGGIAAGAIDSHFSMGTSNSFKLMGLMFVLSFIKDVALYLSQSPLPKVKTVTTTTKVMDQPAPGEKRVTTIEETHVEPISPPPPAV
jgi:hypothetical protein